MTPKPAGRPRPSVLLFDFGGTLDSDGVAWKTRFLRLWREEVAEIDPAEFDRAFYDADDSLVGTVAAGTSLAETARRIARGLARSLGAGEDSSVERVGARFCADASRHLRASAALLEGLKPAYKLGIVSNFYGNLETVCAESGLDSLISAAIDSADVGFTKPDSRIFQAALSALGAGPSEALFIGDSPERDMAGARALGMGHVLLSDPALPARSGCCPDDRVIRRLGELTEVLA